MPNVKTTCNSQGRAEMSTAYGVSCFLKLVRDAHKGADHDHRLCMKPSANNSNQAANGIGIFYRRAPKLQHHEIFSRFKSASLRQFGHKSTPILKFAGTKKPTARLLLAVGSDLGYECSSLSGPVLQKTRNSCRHNCVCRCNSRGLLGRSIHKGGAFL